MTREVRPVMVETLNGARIHRIPLEVFPGFRAFVYVLQKDDFCILIDCGSGMEDSHQQLLDGLQNSGISTSDLTHILLTHAHIDHFGGLSKLRPITGASIFVHELDLQAVAHHESRLALIGRRLASFLVETGLSEERRDQLLGIYRFTKALYQSVPVDFTYESVGMRLGPLEMIHLPGHCPGHIAIRMDDVIFCGDMVVKGVTPHLSPESINPYSGLDHYLKSLAQLQHWTAEARLILNGHDEPITDLAVQIASTRQNILRRLNRAVEALAQPLTIEQTCKAVYGEMDGYNQLLVIEKTGAYIEYLYEYGLVEITNPEEYERGEPASYRRLLDEISIMAELERKVNTFREKHV